MNEELFALNAANREEASKVKHSGLSKIEITTEGTLTKVIVNGEDLSGCTDIIYRHNGNNVPTLTVIFPVNGAKVRALCSYHEMIAGVSPDWPHRHMVQEDET